MTATDELRRLLDERDVKYQKLNEHVTWVFLEDRVITFFSDELGVSAEVSYPKPVLNGTKFLTPDQAIAATLGRGTGEWVLEHSGTLYDKWRCSKCGYLFVEPRCDHGYSDLEPNFCPKCGVDFREVVGE